jgi:hypothetical protein
MTDRKEQGLLTGEHYIPLGTRAAFIVAIPMLVWGICKYANQSDPLPAYFFGMILMLLLIDVGAWIETNYRGGCKIGTLCITTSGKVWLSPKRPTTSGYAIEVAAVVDKEGKVYDFTIMDTLRPCFPDGKQA